MIRSEIGKLMEGIARAKAGDDDAGQQNATAALAPLLAEMKVGMRTAVHALARHAKQASGNDNAR
jgi:hypothetical protein